MRFLSDPSTSCIFFTRKMSISGKYQLEKNDHFYEHLIAMGIAEDKAKIVDNLRPIVEIALEDKKLTIKTLNGDFLNKSEFIFEEEVNESLGLDIYLKSIAKRVDGNTIEILSTGAEGLKGRRLLAFSEHTMSMTIESDSKSLPIAKRYYKRTED